ncbi:hypothetical protein CUMW_066200 [Citrus unshiu]|nr:hypothetical protein CUMW_066200 [Citrus unshiu]
MLDVGLFPDLSLIFSRRDEQSVEVLNGSDHRYDSVMRKRIEKLTEENVSKNEDGFSEDD